MHQPLRWVAAGLAALTLTSAPGPSAAGGDGAGPEERMLFRRAVEAAVWAMPLVGLRGFLTATRRDLGGDWNEVVYFSAPAESRHRLLTANNQTPYVVLPLTTREGPLVVEIPAATDKVKYFGSFVDVWQSPLTDVGPQGADRGRGGRYLFLPPGYGGTVPESGYLVFRPRSYAVYGALRPVAGPGASLEDVVAYSKSLKVYPLGQADAPPETRFLDAYPREWDTLPRYDLSFFETIAEVVREEPVLEQDLAMMGLLCAIGIEKEKPFAPDARLRRILETAAAEANRYLQWLFVNRAFRSYLPGTRWSVFDLPMDQARAGWPFVTDTKMLIDERANLYHFATFMPKKLGRSSFYLATLYDDRGLPLAGNATYRLRMPADVPARDFWSITVYSFGTHAFIEGAERVGVSSLDRSALRWNADGSVDLYFAPSPPAGHETNWIPTGERFWVALRLFGPQRPVFERTWGLGDVERVR